MKLSDQIISVLLSLFSLPIYWLGISKPLLAEVPAFAKITNIIGSNAMSIRRHDGQFEPVSTETLLYPLDRLEIPYNNGSSFATLEFYRQDGTPLGIKVQVTTKNKLRTTYYFPCLVDTEGVFIIEWRNPQTRARGCEKGIKIQSNAEE